jgi:3-methyladenine DNA glycosylase AlkD
MLAPMQPTEVMKRLEQLGTEQTVKTLRRHGIGGPVFGVSYAELYKLQKQIKVDQPLALTLFDTGNHDARILATLIADPTVMTAKDLEAWQGAADNYGLNAAVAGVAARSPAARTLADRWRKAKAEYRSAAGWSVVSALAARDDADEEWLRSCMAEIRAGLDGAPNWTRYSMNNALIAIGGYHPALRADALAVAKSIGKVEVDHGNTECKTPDASQYIAKMAGRQAKKAAKKKATKPAATPKPAKKAANGAPAKAAAKKTAKATKKTASNGASAKNAPAKKAAKKTARAAQAR